MAYNSSVMNEHQTTARPFDLVQPLHQAGPIVLASPHSGRDYAASFLVSARLDATSLRRSEDAFVDELFAFAPRIGVPLLAARFPRAWCDANREPWELDPGMFDTPLPSWVNVGSPRVAAGLGTIARVVSSGEPIYRNLLSFEEVQQRIRSCWEPYHAALASLIAQTRAQFGSCLLIDCHSMPAHPPHALDPPDFVLGDAHGTTCAPQITRTVELELQSLKYRVRRNDPYAGGYITRYYGRPKESVHALQIEISRRLYLHEEAIRPNLSFPILKSNLESILRNILSTKW